MASDTNLKNKKIMLSTWGATVKDHYHYLEWYPIFQEIFAKAILFSPRDQYFRYGKSAMNSSFLELIQKEQPDFLIIGVSYDEYYLETLKQIRQVSPNTKIIGFFGDDEWRYDDWTRHYALFFDYNITAQLDNSNYEEDGIKNAQFLHGSSAKEFHPKKMSKKYDVTFMGAPISDRSNYVRFLYKNGINIKIFGFGWDKYPDLAPIYGGYLKQKDYENIFHETKVNLSFSKSIVPEARGQLKGRVYEIAASKEFGLIEYTKANSPFLKKNSKLTFKTQEELLQKVKHFLKNDKEREKYAASFYKDFLKNYTWENQFKRFFTKIAKIPIQEWALPKLDKQVVYLSEADLKSDIKEKVKDADYICFTENGCKIDKERNYVQIYSLEKSGKNISCSDYYVYSKELGDYLLFSAKKAFYALSKNDFAKLIRPGQLMMEKKFFLAHLKEFKWIFNHANPDLINENSTVFVSIPVVSVKNVYNLPLPLMEKAFQMRFKDKLYSLYYQKKILHDPYLYKLILKSLASKGFIIGHLFNSVVNKDNWIKLKGIVKL